MTRPSAPLFAPIDGRASESFPSWPTLPSTAREALLSWLHPRDMIGTQATPSHLPAVGGDLAATHRAERTGSLVRLSPLSRPASGAWLHGELLRATLLDAAQWSAAGRPSLGRPATFEEFPAMIAAGVPGETRYAAGDAYTTLADAVAALDGASLVVLAVENDRRAALMHPAKRAFCEAFNVFVVA